MADPVIRRIRALLGQGLVGLVPAAPTSPSGKFLDATGGWSTPAGGGASTHSSLAGLRWVGSGHTDTAYSIPWFVAAGAAATFGVGSLGQFLGSAGLTPSWSIPTVAGDASGTIAAVQVDKARGLRETSGPTTLVIGAVADGQTLKRVGSTVVGAWIALAYVTAPMAEIDAPGSLLGSYTTAAGAVA